MALTFAMLAPLSVAQVITVTPSGSVTGGDSVAVGFADPKLAGQTITIFVSNGEPGPFHEEVPLVIKLDGDGKGSTSWIADGSWDQAVFSGEGAARVSVVVN